MLAYARRGHVGSNHRGRLRIEDGPRGSSYITKPLAFIRWISCGRIEANCNPSTCVNSAIDTLMRRRNSEIMKSCVGSDIGRVPLEVTWRATVRYRCAHYTGLREGRGENSRNGEGHEEGYLVTAMWRPTRLQICNLLP